MSSITVIYHDSKAAARAAVEGFASKVVKAFGHVNIITAAGVGTTTKADGTKQPHSYGTTSTVRTVALNLKETRAALDASKNVPILAEAVKAAQGAEKAEAEAALKLATETAFDANRFVADMEDALDSIGFDIGGKLGLLRAFVNGVTIRVRQTHQSIRESSEFASVKKAEAVQRWKDAEEREAATAARIASLEAALQALPKAERAKIEAAMLKEAK